LRLVHAVLAVAIGTALAGATAYAGSGEATVQRQRVAINMVVDDSADTGAFTVKPLTPGRMKSDKGTVIMGGAAFGETVRNGMSVVEVERRPSLDGRRGTLVLVQRFDTHEIQNGVRVGVGTWKIKSGTGTYSRIKGGGRYVAVSMTNGRTLVRQEGWVTVTG
jgi:hypothetical protein